MYKHLHLISNTYPPMVRLFFAIQWPFLASPCARPFCPWKHMLYHTKRSERYLLTKRYLVLFLRKKSRCGSAILLASSLVPWLRKVMFVVEQKTFLVKVGQRRTFVSDMYRVSNYISIERSTVELNRNLKGNLLLNGSFAIFFRQYLQMINSPWFERL